MRLLLSLSLLLICFPSKTRAQAGCTDPQASNYNPGAATNDGSCAYPVTSYTLTQKTLLSTTLNETSGLVMAGGALWTHNDGGNPAAIYKIDTLSNSMLQTVNIGGASNVDWEDIAFDGSSFYIGDFGNNANGNRTDLKIYKFPLSAIPSGANVTVPAGQVEIIHFSYEDQTDYTPQGANNTEFDCESMFYCDGELHLFTKDWVNLKTARYTLPTVAGTYLAAKQETYNVNGLLTAADISGPGVVALLGYTAQGGSLFFWLLWDYQPDVYFSGNKRRIGLGSWFGAGQVEGICFRNGSYGYVSNERNTALLPARLFSFKINQWLQTVFLPIELTRLTARRHDGGVLLEWETATERHSAGFAVERSENGLHYREFAFVAAAGESAAPQFYQHFDPDPGRNRYYRLRLRDTDGSEQLSPAVVLPLLPASDCLPSPNPLPKGQALAWNAPLPENAQLSVYDVWGRAVWRGRAQAEPPVLASGVYAFQVQVDGQVCVAKIVAE